jgi:RNA-binding protein
MSATSLTSKERAYLRSLANTMDPIFQYGKEGMSENFIKQIDDAIEVRELIKISVLENADADVKELASEICEKAHCQSVQIIGRRIVFYRQARDKDKRKIVLPK